VKSRKRLPAWLENAVSQAEAAAKPPQLPVAVLHQDGKGYQDALVVLRLKDFDKRLGCECARLVRVEEDSTKEPTPERRECLLRLTWWTPLYRKNSLYRAATKSFSATVLLDPLRPLYRLVWSGYAEAL
jgi:hypothetical protein